MPYHRLSPITAAGTRQIAGQPLDTVPDPPAWMGDDARSVFVAVAEYLVGIRAVTAGEVPLIAQYAAVYSRWQQAEAALASGADPGWRTVLTRQGTPGSSVPTPMMLQSQRSIEQLRKLSSLLGLSPVERARLPAGRDGGPPDDMEELLQQAGASAMTAAHQ